MLNCDYVNFQKLVDKAILIENKKNEIEREGKRKMFFSRQSSRGNPRPSMMLPPNTYYHAPNPTRPPMQAPCPAYPMQCPGYPATHANFQAPTSKLHAPCNHKLHALLHPSLKIRLAGDEFVAQSS